MFALITKIPFGVFNRGSDCRRDEDGWKFGWMDGWMDGGLDGGRTLVVGLGFANLLMEDPHGKNR